MQGEIDTIKPESDTEILAYLCLLEGPALADILCVANTQQAAKDVLGGDALRAVEHLCDDDGMIPETTAALTRSWIQYRFAKPRKTRA